MVIRKYIFSYFHPCAWGKNGCGRANSLHEHFWVKWIVASCFSYPNTPILMYDMPWLFGNIYFHIFTGAFKVKKWAWPKMGVAIKIKIGGIANMIQNSLKYPKPVLTPY